MINILYYIEEQHIGESLSWFLHTDATEIMEKRSAVSPMLSLSLDNEELRIYFVGDEGTAHRILEHIPIDLLLLDDSRSADGESIHCLNFLRNIHFNPDPDKAFSLKRVMAVLPNSSRLPGLCFAYGKLNISDFLIRQNKADSLLTEIVKRIHSITPGKIALCLAGGGLEGLLYELGVVMALNSILIGRSIHDFDIYCGINVGSILATFLAFGFDPDDLLKAFKGERNSTLEPITYRTIYDLALSDYLVHLYRTLSNGASHSRRNPGSLFLRLAPQGIFRGKRIEDYIERQFKRLQIPEYFPSANKELYIGATNQDTSEHVIFGSEGYKDVSVSEAIRASCSLPPFYLPRRIGNNYYADGQITRTVNFHYAMARGAKFLIIVNPYRPIEVGTPGYVAERGGVFEALQALKSLINTRFKHALNHQIEKSLDVDHLIFQPYSEEMKSIGGSSMKYSMKVEIVRLAYNGVIRKINTDFDFYRRKFNRHGLDITMGRVIDPNCW